MKYVLQFLLWRIISLRASRGSIGDFIPAVIGGSLLIVSYFMFPHVYYNFFHFLLDQFYDALNQSFGGGQGQRGATGASGVTGKAGK